MDPNDEGTMREEIMRAEAISRRKPELQACGFCHYCSESVGSGMQFCDTDCRDGWELEQAARRRNNGA